MTKGSEYDVDKWLEKIKNKGFKKFQFKELPDNLKDKKLLMKAVSSDRIIKVEKSNNCIKTWRIRD